MFERFGDKYHEFMAQVVTVDGKEYLMKKNGKVYLRKPNWPELKDTEIVEQVREQAAKDGGWVV